MPLSLYVHLPWCVRKCPYCDFNSYERHGELPEVEYVDALLRDLDADRPLAEHRPLESIFLGGGTPSLFSGAAITRLLDGIRARVPLVSDVEVSLEANPGAVEAARFGEYREAGVNRLSIGAQSFRDPQLATLKRAHGAADACRAIEIAKRAGFDDLNVDLMYALPSDDLDGALGDLTTAIALQPTHVSWYQLTLEPNTAFCRRPPVLPAEDLVLEIEAAGRALLARHGFERYEISAYARSGHRCRHNLNYWQFGDYLGIGAGAHGKITLADRSAIIRRTKHRNPRTYMEHAGSSEAATEERIESPEQLIAEFMMNALRLPDGIGVAQYRERTGQPAELLDVARREAVRRGWLNDRHDVLVPTAAGLRMLNPLISLFV